MCNEADISKDIITDKFVLEREYISKSNTVKLSPKKLQFECGEHRGLHMSLFKGKEA
jgi:hypothetical protein